MIVADLPSDVFIFNEKNKGFIDGQSRQIAGEGAIQRTLKFATLFYLSLALPISVLVALFFMLLTKEPFVSAFLRTTIVLLILTLYITFSAYRMRKTLEMRGQLLAGEIDSYDSRLTFSPFGYRMAPRIKYRFQSPTGKTLFGYVIIPPKNATQLSDGRELPKPGTSVAVLYTSDRSHTLL